MTPVGTDTKMKEQKPKAAKKCQIAFLTNSFINF